MNLADIANGWMLVFWRLAALDKAVVDSPFFSINLVKKCPTCETQPASVMAKCPIKYMPYV